MANLKQILNLAVVTILSFSLVTGTVIIDTFYLRENQFNRTSSSFVRLETSSKSECFVKCLGVETCFAVAVSKALGSCMLLIMENEFDEIYQISIEPNIWFKDRNNGFMKLSIGPTTAALKEAATATTERSDESFVGATATPSVTTTANCTGAFSCPNAFTLTCQGCFLLDGTSFLQWEAARAACSGLDSEIKLALPSTPEVF